MPNSKDIIEFISRVNLEEPTWDLFILLFFVLAVLLYGFSMGKSRLVVNMVAIYVAMVIAQAVERLRVVTVYMPAHKLFMTQIAVFLIAFVGLYYLLGRKSPLERVVRSARKEKLLHIVAYSIAHVGLIVTVILSFIPESIDVHFSSATQIMFLHDYAYIGWIVLPVILMIIFPEKIHRTYDG